MSDNWIAPAKSDAQATQSSTKAIPHRISSAKIAAPKAMRKNGANSILVTLAMKRANRFGLLSAIALIGALAWCGVRFYLMIDGENQVSEKAFRKLSESIARTIQTKVQQDLIYQDMIANVWAAEPTISRATFRDLVLSEAYSPGLETMTGISLIPRVLGAAERATLENNTDSERLRAECCANASSTGGSCAVVAATGLFCDPAGAQRYQITEFKSGKLVPANATSAAYLERVGSEEYMVVDVIEPFETNSKVWGFNLLSNPVRHAAWVSAMSSGKKTFTRRLNLVQSTSAEYGVLVWLPVFKNSTDGEWTTALDGEVTGLQAVGSVNGVYRLQHLLTTALRSTYSEAQLSDTSVFLFDNAAELNGEAQFLAASVKDIDDPYKAFGDTPMSNVTAAEGTLVERLDLQIANSDAKWVVVVVANTRYLGKRRTNNPWIALVISVVMVIGGTMERWLGHPSLLVEYVNAYDHGQTVGH